MIGELINGLQVGAGLLMLAGSPPPMKCVMSAAPVVRVTPRTEEIRYDYTRSGKELDVLAGRALQERPGGRDRTTGGLRVDTPSMESRVQWEYNQQTLNGKPIRTCMWYTLIEVNIYLKPQIYIAKEQPPGVCGDAILYHEREHVEVDRKVINRFAQQLGVALKAHLDATGVVGPFPPEQLNQRAELMKKQVSQIVEAHKNAMLAEMKVLQQRVDSEQEYARISAICNSVGTK